MLRLFRPSGGLSYHWRARKSLERWKPFTMQIEAWLQTWNIERKDGLLLMGPSAGYTLPSKWLAEFAFVRAYDLDPLAPWFWRHHKIPFETRDLFFEQGRLSLEPLKRLLLEQPSANLLFCNVLGQVPLEGKVSETEWSSYLAALRQTLNDRCFASFHDVYTIEPMPASLHNGFASDYLADRNLKSSMAKCGAREAVDHGLSGIWKAGLKSKLFTWSLTSQSLHIIESINN